MEHEDIYNGVKIKISTYSNAAGSWQATAQFASGPEKTLDLQGSFELGTRGISSGPFKSDC